MRFKSWMENVSQPFEIPIKRIYGWEPKVVKATQEVLSGATSRTDGSIIVSRLDSPRGSFFLIDGYHRVIEADMAGKLSVLGRLDEFVPRIERTGGAHASMVQSKIPILSYRELINYEH